jgi:hypothetical protein
LAWGPNIVPLLKGGAVDEGVNNLNLYQLLTLDILLKNHHSLEELKKMMVAAQQQQQKQQQALLTVPMPNFN